MSTFAAKYVWVPSGIARCGCCHASMPRLARVAPLARAMGWRYGYDWLCPMHRAAVYPEIRRGIEDSLRRHREFEVARLSGKYPDLFAPVGPSAVDADSPLPAAVAHSPHTFGLVVVVAESFNFPFAEQLEQHLLRTLAANPAYPLAPETKLTAMHVPALPSETRAAMEPFVGSLQERYERRGGRWQTVFHPTTLGIAFLVVYLE